jgi:hypothetical protein
MYGIIQMPFLVNLDRYTDFYFTPILGNNYKSKLLRICIYPDGKGALRPTMAKLFPYHKGDFLIYKETASFSGPPPVVTEVYKYSILSREEDASSNRLNIQYKLSKRVANSDEVGVWSWPLDSTLETGTLVNSLYNSFSEVKYFRYSSNGALYATLGLHSYDTAYNCYSRTCCWGEAGLQEGIGETGSSDENSPKTLDCYSLNGVVKGPCSTLLSLDKRISNFVTTNPITSELVVESPTPLHLTLQDLQGRTVTEGFETTRLNTAALPAGLYVLKIQDKSGRTIVQRVMKE